MKEFTEKGFTNEGQVEKLSNLIGIPILGSIPFIQEISKLNPEIFNNDDSNDIENELVWE